MKLIKPHSLGPSLQASEPANTQLPCLEVCHLSHVTLESSARSRTSSQGYELVAFREAASVH